MKLKCCGQKPFLGRTVGGAIPQQLAHLHGAVPRIPAPEAGERARRRVGHVGRLERGEQPLGQRVKIRVAAKTGPVNGRHRVVKRGLQAAGLDHGEGGQGAGNLGLRLGQTGQEGQVGPDATGRRQRPQRPPVGTLP